MDEIELRLSQLLLEGKLVFFDRGSTLDDDVEDVLSCIYGSGILQPMLDPRRVNIFLRLIHQLLSPLPIVCSNEVSSYLGFYITEQRDLYRNLPQYFALVYQSVFDNRQYLSRRDVLSRIKDLPITTLQSIVNVWSDIGGDQRRFRRNQRKGMYAPCVAQAVQLMQRVRHTPKMIRLVNAMIEIKINWKENFAELEYSQEEVAVLLSEFDRKFLMREIEELYGVGGWMVRVLGEEEPLLL